MYNSHDIFNDSYQRILRQGKTRTFFSLLSKLALSDPTLKLVLGQLPPETLEKTIHIGIIVLINYSVYHIGEERFDLDAGLFLAHTPPIMHPKIAKAWLHCIQEAVKSVDNDYSEVVWQAWLETLTPGLERLKRHYNEYIQKRTSNVMQHHSE